MKTDPIVEEVRKARSQHAARFNNDLKAIVADLKKQEKRSGRKYVKLMPKSPIRFPKQTLAKEVKVS